jgi:phosphoglycerate dehydrogenase-like enzyme
MATALGLEVTVFAPRRREADGFRLVSGLEEGLEGADILSLHLPLTAETRGMIDHTRLQLLAPGALVINTARGGIVDEVALAALSEQGHIGGVGFDVFDGEPVRADSPLLSIQNAVLTPHCAAMSDGAKRAMAVMAAQNVLDGLSGRIDPGMIFKGS